MYLLRRNGHYWFRKATPLDLIPILGQADVRCSLRTTRRDEAKRRAGQLLVALENVYAVLRSDEPLEPTKALLRAFLHDARVNSAGTPESMGLTSARLQQVEAALGVPEISALELCEVQKADGPQTLVAADDIDFVLAREQPRTESNRIAADLLGLATRIRREKSWPRAERAKMLVSLCQKLVAANNNQEGPKGLEAIRAVIREEILRAGFGTAINQTSPFDAASLRDVVAQEVRAGVTSAGRDRWSIEPLSKAIEKFLEAHYAAGEGKSKIGSKHRQDVERRLAAFLAFTGDLAVRDITRDHLKTYRDALDRLPDRFELRLKTADMRLALARNATRRVPFPVIGPTTINLKWLGPIDRLFDWLVAEERVEKNLLDGIRSQQDASEAANTKRLAFRPEQISKIFAMTGAASAKTALHWLPLLMLTTGARPNELAQLRTDDLDVTFNGRPHLNVLCLLDDDDESVKPGVKAEAKQDPRRVKTAAGRRMIPLHPILIKAGFIEFVEGRQHGAPKQLFRELRPDRHGFWSASINKRLNRIIRGRLFILNPKYSVYSFRHAFIDACKVAGIPEETRMKFVGHQLSGVHGIYGNPFVLKNESALIDSVQFEGVVFGRYLSNAVVEDDRH